MDRITISLQKIKTPIGEMIAAASRDGLCLLEFSDRAGLEDELKRLEEKLTEGSHEGAHRHLELARQQLSRYFECNRAQFTVPVVLDGTQFERAVWQAVRSIPAGETRTYAQIAEAVGRPHACRAVGRANGRNPIAIIVPCHRLVGSDGSLCGYGGGLWRKQWLLEHETLADNKTDR